MHYSNLQLPVAWCFLCVIIAGCRRVNILPLLVQFLPRVSLEPFHPWITFVSLFACLCRTPIFYPFPVWRFYSPVPLTNVSSFLHTDIFWSCSWYCIYVDMYLGVHYKLIKVITSSILRTFFLYNISTNLLFDIIVEVTNLFLCRPMIFHAICPYINHQ